MSWIDNSTYPWHLDIAQQLHRNIVKLKPSRQMAEYLAETAGIDTSFIHLDRPVFFLWKEILDAAANDVVLRSMLTDMSNDLKPSHPYKKFFEEILSTGNAPIEAEPVDAQGKPAFITGKDEFTKEEESLLYGEDLTLPIGKLRALINTLEKLETLQPAICRFVVAFNNNFTAGTGFRIGEKMLLTNHHVFHSKSTGDQATAVTAHFGYNDNGAGGFSEGTKYNCDPASIKSNKENDWAVIQLSDALPPEIPIIELNKATTPTVNDQAFIIQHPLGGTKRLGYVRNAVSFVTETITHYLTDTQQGSSGAPVFNGEGLLIALHRAGGRPIDLPGQQPMKKNEGILISKILENFSEQNIQII